MKKLIVGTVVAGIGLGLGLSSSAQAANAISTQELVSYCKGKDATFVTCEIYGQAVYDT